MKIFKMILKLLLAFLIATMTIYFLMCAIFAPTMGETVMFIVLSIVSMFNFFVWILALAKESEEKNDG